MTGIKNHFCVKRINTLFDFIATIIKMARRNVKNATSRYIGEICIPTEEYVQTLSDFVV